MSVPQSYLEQLKRVARQLQEETDPQRHINLCRRALALLAREQDPGSWAALHALLTKYLYSDRFRQPAANSEESIEAYTRALEVYTREAFPEDWARSQNNLGNAYCEYISGGRAENLEWAIKHYERALEVFTCEALPEDWAGVQNNIGNAYGLRICGNRGENLERAIECYDRALDVYTRETFPKDWARANNNLGMVYRERIRGERAENLERAIEYYDRALEIYTREAFPEDWARAQNNLGNAYRARVRDERAENLERAIEHCDEALKVYTRGAFPAEWARAHNNLGMVYRERMRGERAENLERAIGYYDQALKVYAREAFPEDWAGAQNNLGNVYRERIRGERAGNLERAIKHARLALEVYTREAFPEDWARTQNNLGAAYGGRIRGARAENLKRAIEHYGQALEIYKREAFPAEHQRTQRNLGDLHFECEDWTGAHVAYTGAIAAGGDLLAQAYTEPGRRAEVEETARLFARDAYALLRVDRPGLALLTLEQGKTRLLNEALALGGLDLVALPEAERAALGVARQARRELEAEQRRLPPGTSGQRAERELNELLRQAKADLDCVIAAIRAARPDFMPSGLDLPGLLDLAPEGGALVAPVFTAKGSAAFVLPHSAVAVTEAHVCMLDRFTDADLRALLMGPKEETTLGGWLGAYGQEGADAQAWLAAIETTGRALWDGLLGPVHERLDALGLAEGAPVLLLPQGGLGLLPLHAAWREVKGGKRRYFLDDYTVAYAPSGYALATSRGRLDESRRQQHSLLAVVDPTESLAFAPAEVGALASLFAEPKQRILPPDQATPEAVLGEAPECNYLHFACHGSYNWPDPMQSGLDLAGRKRLTLADAMVRLDLGAARLIVLSACETGLTDIRQSPDEFLGLPAGFLQAGAPAVASTLWPVEDLSTTLLMERFYRGHLEEKLTPASALRAAQRWLRDATTKKLKLAECWEQVYLTTANSELRKKAFRAMRYYQHHLDEQPFVHPYHWAAFTLVGA